MELDPRKQVTMTVTGTNWGLACNSIHFMDFFRFLTGKGLLQIESSLTAPVPTVERGHFFEFYGEVTGFNDKHDTLEMYCTKDLQETSKTFEIDIQNGNSFHKTFIFRPGQIEIRNRFYPTATPIVCAETYQSNLTNIIVDELLKTGNCGLPRFETSALDHILLVNNFLDSHGNHAAFKNQTCPIT